MRRESQDTVPHTVRMPRGAAERLRVATGMDFSTLMRLQGMKLLIELEKRGANQRNEIAGMMEQIAGETING